MTWLGHLRTSYKFPEGRWPITRTGVDLDMRGASGAETVLGLVEL